MGGLQVGLIKIRMFRPFPRERLVKALNGKKALGVIDRHPIFGWNCGHVFFEVKGLQNDLATRIPMVDFLVGAGGADITIEHMERAIDTIHDAAEGRPVKEVTWLSLE